MRGAPLADELKKMLLEKAKGKPAAVPKDAEFLDDMAATRTAYQQDAALRDFELKKKTIMTITAATFDTTKEYRATTQGKNDGRFITWDGRNARIFFTKRKR